MPSDCQAMAQRNATPILFRSEAMTDAEGKNFSVSSRDYPFESCHALGCTGAFSAVGVFALVPPLAGSTSPLSGGARISVCFPGLVMLKGSQLQNSLGVLQLLLIRVVQ